MPKWLISKIRGLISDSSDQQAPKARVISASDHDFRPEDLSPSAVTVIETLTDAGHEAYLVGGCIRDALSKGRLARSFRPDAAGFRCHDPSGPGSLIE